MKNLSLMQMINEILNVGFAHTPNLVKKAIPSSLKPWEQQFDLRSWKDWKGEVAVYKNEVAEHGSAQEVSVRVIFKRETAIGFISLPIVAITSTRIMPVGEWKELPHHEEEFTGCLWSPTEIRYHKSPSTMNEMISLDPLKKGSSVI